MARMTLDELTRQLQAAYGDALVSVVLYGSAAGGEHIAKRSDYNVLVIVKAFGLDAMRAASAVARAWADAGNPSPLTFTEREWRSSADIFPMEYADVLERHRVLAGTLPLDGIAVDPRHLRLQLERETMGTLLKLRQGALATGGVESRLVELMSNTIGTIVVQCRAVLRLGGESPPAEKLALIQSVARLASIDGAAFERAVRHARGETPIRPADAVALMGAYLVAVERLVAWLDRHAANLPSTPGARHT
jgi:predicted nucleotidyltransferase